MPNRVVELRQYTLRPGRRDALIDLFDREFVESQESMGMTVIGQFRDLDRPDRFVWLRGFPDMAGRRTALEGFYGGPVWKANSDAANATMLDVDDVLLLRPLTPASGFLALPPRPSGEVRSRRSVVSVTVCSLSNAIDVSVAAETVLPILNRTGPPPVAVFVEEPSENNFPALPIRRGEHVLVWIQRSARSETRHIVDAIPNLRSAPLVLRLEPTPRSRLH